MACLKNAHKGQLLDFILLIFCFKPTFIFLLWKVQTRAKQLVFALTKIWQDIVLNIP